MVNQLIPNLRFPEFQGEFKSEIFNNILSITRLAGYEYSKYWQEDDNKEIIALRGYNIGNGKLELRDLSYISNELSLQLKRSRLNKGDIIYPCVGSIGNAVVIEENDKYHIQQNIAKITCNKTTSPYFISQFLMSHLGMKEVMRFNATSSQPNVLVGSLRQFSINLPSLPEQQKIASFLSDVDNKITKLTKKKELLEQYKKGIMQKIFSQKLRFKDDNGNAFPKWEIKKLGNVFSSFKGKGIPKGDVITDGNYKCVLYGELYTTYNEVIKKVVSSTNSEDGLRSKKGDLLIPSSTTTTGIDLANVTALNFENVLLGGDIIVMRGKKEINNVFYAYYLSNFKKHQIASRAQGITIVHIYFNSIKDLEIDVPVVEEQTKIANFLSDIDVKIEALNTKIEQSKAFKKGLLQQMFV